LKLLEEPPEKTLFLLVTENQESILSTIISRTQLIKVPRFSETDIELALINNFNTLLIGLRDAQTRARHALDPANPAPGGPYQPIPALPPLAQPARGGKRKSKRHQKKSKKTNKKRSKKTAKKGKKMRGGYSYGKSKRRRGRNSPSSSVPSSLSSASKNVILF
jgi:hypothetical protein